MRKMNKSPLEKEEPTAKGGVPRRLRPVLRSNGEKWGSQELEVHGFSGASNAPFRLQNLP